MSFSRMSNHGPSAHWPMRGIVPLSRRAWFDLANPDEKAKEVVNEASEWKESMDGFRNWADGRPRLRRPPRAKDVLAVPKLQAALF